MTVAKTDAKKKLLAWPTEAGSDNQGEGGAKRSRGEKRGAQVLDVALRLFHEQGYSATSMDGIASAVGILKGSLYYYMDSKEDLLFRIVEHVHDTVTDLQQTALARADLSPLERVVEFVRLQLRYNATHVTELAVYHQEWKRLEAPRYDDIARRRHANEAILIDLLEQAKLLGEVPKKTDSRLALAHVLAVVVWPYTWYDPRSRTSADQLADSGAEFVRGALSTG